MKTLLLASLLLSAGPVWAQAVAPVGAESTQPAKRDNVIVLYTADSTAAAYTKLGRLLLAEGYAIEKSDKELGYFATGYKPTSNRAVETAFRFFILPHAGGAYIQMRGFSKIPSLGQGNSPIDFRGMNGSPAAIAWQEMKRLSAAYQAQAIGYRHQP